MRYFKQQQARLGLYLGKLPTLNAALACGLILLSLGCSNLPTKPSAPKYPATLLSGEAVFTKPVAVDDYPIPALLTHSQAMADFVKALRLRSPNKAISHQHLLSALAEQGYFDGTYDIGATHSAAQTFRLKRGNCLAYTSMFISLARLSGLAAGFQLVDVPPTWQAGSQYLIRSKHINALVHRPQLSVGNSSSHSKHSGVSPTTIETPKKSSTGKETIRVDTDTVSQHPNSLGIVVDFNFVSARPGYRRQPVSDHLAHSLMLANLAVQALLKQEQRLGFHYLRASIQVAPEHADHWVNLGAFYATHRAFAQAQQAYLVALELAPKSRTAHAAIARAYAHLGKRRLAEHHNRLAKHYQRLNPYYHFSLAQRALHENRPANALTAINMALELNSRFGGFHFLKAIALEQLGEDTAAQRSLAKARRYGQYEDLKNELRKVFGEDIAEPAT